MTSRRKPPPEPTAPPPPPEPPFTMTDGVRLRAQALDMVIRAVGVVRGWQPANATELTKEAEELEKWLKKAP